MKFFIETCLYFVLSACAGQCPDFTGSPNTSHDILLCHAKYDDSHAQFLLGLHHERAGEMEQAIDYYLSLIHI